jgi:4-hydroxy-4-methyl-2-oxoglutarate aldolase
MLGIAASRIIVISDMNLQGKFTFLHVAPGLLCAGEDGRMTFDVSDRAKLSAAGTSGLSDAMERLGLPRGVITGFRCSTEGVAVGTAFTIRQIPKHASATHDQRLVRHGEVSRDLAQPGDFVVVDAGGRTDIAGWGENHSARCQARGVSGALINGATRDVAGIRRLGFPVFHLGGAPVASRWDQETAEIGGPVFVGGVQIRPGDVLVADEDGLIVIAPAQLVSILAELPQ